MSDWKEYRLGEVCKMVPGFAFKSNDFGNGNDVAIKIKDIQPPYVETKLADKVDTSKYDLKKLCKFEVHKGEFLLAMTGATIGKIGKYINETPSFVNQRVLKFEDAGIISYDYLYYCLLNNTFQAYILNHIDSQSAQPNISSTTIGKYIIKVPTPNVQKKIASILKSLDDKIEVNRRINENLEQQAQALFKSWFVDFEPFKDQPFVESELCMIPQGWRVENLSSIADYINGLAMQKFRPIDGERGLPVLKIKELGQGCVDNNSELCSPSLIGEKYIIDDGDIIFSWSGTLMVKVWCGGKCGLNQHLFVVIPKDNPKWFVYQWTNYHLDNFIRIAKDKAVTMGHIKRGELDKAMVVVPDEVNMQRIDDLMTPIFEQIISLKKESRRLAELRDTLLPRLMSGELKVQDTDLINEMLEKGIR